MSRREAVALEWCALAKCRFQCDKGKLVLEIGAWQCNSALRIHPILTLIRILGSTLWYSGSGSSDPPFRNRGFGLATLV